MRRLAVVASAVAMLAVWAPAAHGVDGFNPETCLLPDTSGPVAYDFRPGPSQDVTRPGTFMRIEVSDIPYYPFEDSFGNWINLVTVQVDDGAPVAMQPVEGHHRKVRQGFTTVFGPLDLGPGPHDLSFTMRDDCGKIGTHAERIFVVAPGVVATCALPVDLVC